MKKVKYGNKSKSKVQNTLQQLKDGDEDDICNAVLDTLSQDYLSYISNLVKVSNIPQRTFKQDNIQKMFKPKSPSVKTQQCGINYRLNTIESDPKNQTARIMKINLIPEQSIRQNNKLNQTTKNKIKKLVYKQVQNNITQPYENGTDTSIIIKNDLDSSSNKQRFIRNIDEYLTSLTNVKPRQRASSKQKQSRYSHQQDLQRENIKLKRKINQYETKVQQLQESITQHLSYCKNKDKANKAKINDLVKALAQAITKINKQKQQIETMQSIFKNFGKKVQIYNQFEDNSSEQIQDQINQSLSRAMRPTRVRSQYKVKPKKKKLDYTLKRLQQDNFIQW